MSEIEYSEAEEFRKQMMEEEAIDRNIVPRFPIEVYPPVVREFVVALAKANRQPVELPAVIALGAVSSCANGVLHISAPSDADEEWISPAGLYICAVACSGAGKSHVLDSMTKELFKRQKAWNDQKIKGTAKASKERMYDKKLEKAIANGNEEEIIALGNEKDKFIAENTPEMRFLSGTNCTSEGVSSLAENGQKMVAMIDEEGTVLSLLADKTYSKAPNLEPFLKGYDEKPLMIIRKGYTKETNPFALSMLLTTQEKVIDDIFADETLLRKGFVPRFLFGCADCVFEPYEELPPMPKKLREEYDLMLTRAKSAKCKISFSDKAKDAFHEWENEVVAKQHDEWAEANDKGFLGKARGNIVRMSGLLWLMDGQNGLISADQVERAKKLMRYFLANVEYLLHRNEGYFGLKSKKEIGVLKSIQQIARRDGAEMLVSKIVRDYKNKQPSEKVREILRKLADMGMIEIDGCTRGQKLRVIDQRILGGNEE